MILYAFKVENDTLKFFEKIETESAPFAWGGEGEVYNITTPGHKNTIIKIYKKIDAQKFNKLKYMVEHPPADIKCLAWPELITCKSMNGDSSSFVGFTMKKILNAKNIADIYDTDERQRLLPDSTWELNLFAARNIAFLADELHMSNYLLGDINENNILIWPDSTVYFIDCDSYKAMDKNFHESTVGMNEYTCPERLKNGKFGSETKEQERFSLAIIIFKMLMLGSHPFNVKQSNRSNGTDVNRNDNIKICRSVFSEPDKLPSYTPPLYVLPTELQSLFKRAFVSGCKDPYSRPSSREWFDTFEYILKNKNLKKCSVNYHHVYFPSKGNKCPWCELKKNTGTDPFPMSQLKYQIKYHVTFIYNATNSYQRWSVAINGSNEYTGLNNSISVDLPPGTYRYIFRLNGEKKKSGRFTVSKGAVTVTIKIPAKGTNSGNSTKNKTSTTSNKNTTYNTPTYNTPTYNTPTYNTPTYNTPTYNTPNKGTTSRKNFHYSNAVSYGAFNLLFSLIIIGLTFYMRLGIAPLILMFFIAIFANSRIIRGDYDHGQVFVIILTFMLDTYMLYIILHPLFVISPSVQLLLANKFFLVYFLIILYSIFESFQHLNKGHERSVSFLSSIMPLIFVFIFIYIGYIKYI